MTVWLKYEKQIVNFGQNSSYQFVTRFFFFLIPGVHNIFGSIRAGGVLLECRNEGPNVCGKVYGDIWINIMHQFANNWTGVELQLQQSCHLLPLTSHSIIKVPQVYHFFVQRKISCFCFFPFLYDYHHDKTHNS